MLGARRAACKSNSGDEDDTAVVWFVLRILCMVRVERGSGSGLERVLDENMCIFGEAVGCSGYWGFKGNS